MPQTIGCYRVLEKLGEGGMGVVYAALDDRLDRRIAIKTIRSAGSEDLRTRFWREARAHFLAASGEQLLGVGTAGPP